MRKAPWKVKIPGLAAPPPIRTILRSTAYKLSPPRPRLLAPPATGHHHALIAAGHAEPRQLAAVYTEERPGLIPTIVLSGFVPDAPDATYLQRGLFLRHGSAVHIIFSRFGFNEELLMAQLDDLVEEYGVRRGRPPVLFGISFGGGLVLRWLRRQRLAARPLPIAGSVLVSPVTCIADLIDPASPKPTTLLGRVMKGFLERPETPAKERAWVEKARVTMQKMFESGSQNRAALKKVLTRGEVHRMRDAVFACLAETTFEGAWERSHVLAAMEHPGLVPAEQLPLSIDPAMVLYAEKESSVLTDDAPGRLVLERDLARYLPRGTLHVVRNPGGSPVQHASLLFHFYNFHPHLRRFYRSLRHGLSGPRRFQHTLTRMIPPPPPSPRGRSGHGGRGRPFGGINGHSPASPTILVPAPGSPPRPPV